MAQVRLKHVIISLLVITLFTTSFLAQEKSKSVKNKSVEKTKRIQFWVGSVEIPSSYKAKIVDARTDAPYGHISSKDEKVKIWFSYGLVVRAINKENESEFSWIKTLIIDKRQFRYGLRIRNGEKEIAGYNAVNFWQKIEKEEEIELFLKIIKTFKFGQCDNCERVSR